ncbi:replicative DNA helicase [Borreliella burgdorferi]|uniref:replicative DNA helicase n=2 Tax=Borreliella burgdorferi TaxID=139 RepID=UPI000D03E79D|nr:replicative DNA helicase [Borreliella burgdorferi]MCD2320838.1 replicative DNA helicase [Borreliella burgdorferi]MDK7383990.1 replicative DNA helicase [Borreliella burgdorferi]PRR53154.1 replicative DNA helicase [Borreliella burgdorferi]PRR56545.1 replicative DNA helicase [Borreliella burgdorferi]
MSIKMKEELLVKSIFEKHCLFDRDSESAVIGSLLNNTVKLEEVLFYLKPEDFDFDINKKIFTCMIDLHTKGVSIDPVIVLDKLTKDKGFGKVLRAFNINEYIDILSRATVVGSIIENHIRIIKEYSIRREALIVANDIIRYATDKSKNLEDIFDNVQNKINTIELIYKDKNLKHVDDILKEVDYDVFNGKFKKKLTESGFRNLDRIIQGFGDESNFVIIGARPSVGKTAFALNMIHDICYRQNRGVGFFTLEMSSKSIIKRLISIDSCIELCRFDSSLMKKKEIINYKKSISKIRNYPLYIESTNGIQIYELKSQARRMKRIYDIQLIFIDYIGLIAPQQSNIPRFEQVACLSRSIRALALELKIPIIVLSQLTRSAEGKEPSLATLRESGSLEQDADIVIFLHQEREENIRNNDTLDDSSKVKVIVAKNRNGPIGTVTMDFIPKFIKFIDR